MQKLIVALSLIAASSSLVFVVGCGNEKKPATTPTSQAPTLTSAPIKKAADNIGVSEDLAKACKLQLNDITSAPKFDFDKSELSDTDRNVLTKVAECLTTGPLKGRHVKLIGRADTRGEGQYNMALGAHRATGVSDYLGRLGVAKPQLDVTSRGELDAVGTDEVGWATDRRVDVVLQ
jgi:peptidoglycan-associated lipoprotein